MEVSPLPPFCVSPSWLTLAFIPITFHSLQDGVHSVELGQYFLVLIVPQYLAQCRHLIKIVAGLDEHFTKAKILQLNLTSSWYL